MFKSSFREDPLTGVTEFELSFNIGNGEVKDKGSFMNRLDAEKYIVSSKRDYILVLFGKYVRHANVLFARGDRLFYNTTDKVKALDRCNLYDQWLQNKKLEEICRVLVALEPDMRKILPPAANRSHELSEDRVVEMIVFAKEEIRAYPAPKPRNPTTAA